MSRFQKFRNYAGRARTYFKPRRFSRGRFGASINPAWIGGGLIGYTGVADQYLPPLARNILMLYGQLPISIKGLGPLKAVSRGYTAGVILRSTIGNVLPGAGSSASEGGEFL